MSKRQRPVRGGVKPRDVNGQFNLRCEYYRKELWKIVKGIFEVNIPDDWDYGYFIQTLTKAGVVAITNSEIGVKPFFCTTFGVNYMGNPTNVRVTVPTIMSFERTIGQDVELLYIDRLYNKSYYTFSHMVDIFAEKLASADACIDVNIMNSRVAYIAEAESKAEAETLKSIYESVTEGEPFVVYRKDALSTSGINVFFNNIKSNFIADVVQDEKRSIMNEFLTGIGINNANTDKRERLISSEVAANNQELVAVTDVWATNIERCMKRIHAMFPELASTFSVKLKYREETIKSNEAERNGNAMANKESDENKPLRRDNSSD